MNANRFHGTPTNRYCVTVEYRTPFSVKRAPVQASATDCEGAERIARDYCTERLGEFVRIISTVVLQPR